MIGCIILSLCFVAFVIVSASDVLKAHRFKRACIFETKFLPFVYQRKQCTGSHAIAVANALDRMRLNKDPLYDRAHYLYKYRMELPEIELNRLWHEFQDLNRKYIAEYVK